MKKDMIWKGTVTTMEGYADLHVHRNEKSKVFVTYFRQKSGKEIKNYKGAKTIKIMDELLAKASSRVREMGLDLWSY